MVLISEGTGLASNWAYTPDATLDLNTNARNNKAPTFVEALSWNMVPVGGLEPPRPKATDFESVVYTNFTTPASLGYCPLMVGIIRKLLTCASRKTLNNYRLLIISPQSVTKLSSEKKIKFIFTKKRAKTLSLRKTLQSIHCNIRNVAVTNVS